MRKYLISCIYLGAAFDDSWNPAPRGQYEASHRCWYFVGVRLCTQN